MTILKGHKHWPVQGILVKYKPAGDYESLVKQFHSLSLLLSTIEKELTFYRKKEYYATSEERLRVLADFLESERLANHILTNMVHKGK